MSFACNCRNISTVQSLSRVQLFATPRTAACQASLLFTISWSLLKLMSIESMMPSSHLILCHPLLLLPSIFSSIKSFPISQLFTLGVQSIGASASVLVLPMNIQSWFSLGLTSLISLLSKELSRILSSTTIQKHQFFDVQPSYGPTLSYPYLATGKTIAWTRWTFVGKVMSLLFNMLVTFVIAFLPRSKRLLILWLQLPSAGILKPKKVKSVTVSTFSPSICHEAMGQDVIICVVIFRILLYSQDLN